MDEPSASPLAQPSPTPQSDQLALFGPTVSEDGTTFRVWSPGARKLELVLHPETPYERRLPFERQAEGFWQAWAPGVAGGTRYRLRRDDRWPQPDPASPFQPDGVFGPSEVVDFGAYRWRHDDWQGLAADEVVLYEVHVACLDTAGSGTYEDLRRRLPELAELGITGLKLMPLAAAAGAHNWGYDGVFHLAPLAAYGRPQQLQRLVDEAHGLGLAVLLDVVTNHFGPEGNPMWQMSRGFFHREANTAWGPGPRFDREAVLAYFEQMAWHFAYHYRFDGLRVDAVHAIPEAERRPHLERLARGQASGARHGGHLMLESVENETTLLGERAPDDGTKQSRVFVSQLNFDFQRAAHRLLTGERHMEYGEADDHGEALRRCLERGFTYAGDFSSARGRDVGEVVERAPWAGFVNYLVNHDTCGNRYLGQRLQELTSAERFRAATALLLLHPATPYLFMGQEWGTRARFHFFTDFPEGLGRRVERGRLRGFHEVDVDRCEERAPGPQDRQALERSRLDWLERDRDEHRAHWSFTQEVLALRRELRPQMVGSTAGCRARHEGLLFVCEIPAADGRGAFVLAANLGESGLPYPREAEGATLLFRSDEQPAGETEADPAALPPAVTALWRVNSSAINASAV